MSSPFKPEECPRCGVMCKVYVTSDIRSGLCRGKVVLVAKERDQ